MNSSRPGPLTLYTLGTIIGCCNFAVPKSLTCPLVHIRDNDVRRYELIPICCQFLLNAQNPSNHHVELDKILSLLLPCALTQHPSRSGLEEYGMKRDKETKYIETRAAALLSRLPRTPQKCFSLELPQPRFLGQILWERMVEARWSPRYILPEHRWKLEEHVSQDDHEKVAEMLNYMSDIVWDDLYVTTHIDTNSLVLLLHIASAEGTVDLPVASAIFAYVNLLAELLDVFSDFYGFIRARGRAFLIKDDRPEPQAVMALLFPEDDDNVSPQVPRVNPQPFNIVKAFLWGAWQRSLALHFYTIVGAQLRNGYSPEWSSLLAVRGVTRLEEISDHRVGADYIPNKGVDYLCNWSLELLRRSRSSLCLDFRYLLRRFAIQFGHREGRCLRSSTKSCRGDQPSSCDRFTRADTRSQSAHASDCDGQCIRIKWDRTSYTNAQSPRAVCIKTSDLCLRYRKSSADTLAISHVWAHGQGGRPEDGINTCLHRKYTSLALRFACDSYWIDSACIPDENLLRKEAIGGINSIFATSKSVVVSDRDVESVDMVAHNIESAETVVSILLVCDWNVRAWTMLEATRANQSIQVLCKNGETIPLLNLLREVWSWGAVDIAVLLGSAEHLLPSVDRQSGRSLENAGYSLSQRHASRDGDDIVIWGLLNGRSGHDNVVELWKAQKEVRTAFLVSSAPRVRNVEGLGWAPISPCILPQVRSCRTQNQNYTIRYPSYDGGGSVLGFITSAGLHARWMIKDIDQATVREIRADRLELYDGRQLGEDFINIETLPEDAKGYTTPDLATACDIIERLLRDNRRVRVLKPATLNGSGFYTGADHRGDYSGSTALVCSKADRDLMWSWEGVYQWGDESHFWDWRSKEMVIG